MVLQKESHNIDNLIKGLRTVSRNDINWRGHGIRNSDDIRISINKIIRLFKNINKKVDDQYFIELERGLNFLNRALHEETLRPNDIKLKAQCKMRKIINNRLEILLEIVERFPQDIPEIEKLRWRLEDIKEDNFIMLNECEKFLAERSKELREEKSTDFQRFDEGEELVGSKKRRELIKIKNYKKEENHKMVVLLIQSLLGNAYEHIDEDGNQVLLNSFDEMDPYYMDTFQMILNKNYRNAPNYEIKRAAKQAIDLIKIGFDHVGRDLPDYIEDQIKELQEALLNSGL